MGKLIFFISISLFMALLSFAEESKFFLDNDEKNKNNSLIFFYVYANIVLIIFLNS